ncbi:MAG: acylneuraminate cytidylyltransferase family protein [bacterium]|nr:acylneuraminate cytidylyltransferase family protein [bacterium]
MNKKVLATITARGGSKRILKKSIVSLLGKPSMVWVIEALKKSKMVNRVIVDTDSEEMAEVGRRAGAEIPFIRPAHLAEDNTGHLPVLKYELEFLKEKEEYVPDAVVLIQPTSPLVSSEEIDACVNLFFSEDLDSVESVFEVPTHFHPYAQRIINKDGYTEFLFAEEQKLWKKTGQKPKTYTIANVYCFKPSNLEKFGAIQGEKSKSIIVHQSQAVDIDEPFDVSVAEAIKKSSLSA